MFKIGDVWYNTLCNEVALIYSVGGITGVSTTGCRRGSDVVLYDYHVYISYGEKGDHNFDVWSSNMNAADNCWILVTRLA